MPPNEASNDRDEKEHNILKDRKVKMEEKSNVEGEKLHYAYEDLTLVKFCIF